MDIPDPLSPLFPIVHRLWQVFRATSSHSCCMYVLAGCPAFAQPYVGVHRSTSLMSSSLLLQQCPACLVRLTWIVWLFIWLYYISFMICSFNFFYCYLLFIYLLLLLLFYYYYIYFFILLVFGVISFQVTW